MDLSLDHFTSTLIVLFLQSLVSLSFFKVLLVLTRFSAYALVILTGLVLKWCMLFEICEPL
jgi:uncharacterized membrane protein